MKPRFTIRLDAPILLAPRKFIAIPRVIALSACSALGNIRLELRGNVSSVPLPAATWLFGSGLLGLIGMARRNAATA